MTTHGVTVTTTTQRQPYQGYPYVNPVVNDVPSIEPSTSYRKDLPRRPAPTGNPQKEARKDDRNYEIPEPPTSYRNNQPKRPAPTINPQKEVREDDKYDEIPEPTTSYRNNQPKRPSPTRNPQNEAKKDDRKDENPVIYIDIPETSTSEDSNRKNEASIEDDNLPPVIYIDLPQTSNQIAESPTTITNEGTSSSIDDTIYFDQFEDRRITPKDATSITSDDNTSATRIAEPRPGNLTISKETYVYGRLPTPDDGFALAPIPISEFPEPPPAYSEFQQRGPVTQQPTASSVQNPPRTVIITNDSASSQRKLLTCQHCGTRVHTMVLKQAGAATHALALSFLLFCLFPLTILVYCCNWFMYENHYCPNCSKLIGYEVPMLCQTLVYATSDLTRRVTS